MKFSVVALASLLSVASARIIGFAVPKTIRPGDGFNVIIETENYIQAVADIAIAFGVTPGVAFPKALGTKIQSFYLGPEQSNILTNITKYIDKFPATATGSATFAATLFSLYGKSSSGTLSDYAVNVTIGDATSTEYISSKTVH